MHRWARQPYPFLDVREEIRRLIAVRNRRFLSLMRDAVYGYPPSPYLQLMRYAGCDFSDLEAEVTAHGLESTLRRLAGAGVYVTHDEMKSRVPVRRGSSTFDFNPSQFDNPFLTPHFVKSTSGSTGTATWVGISLNHFRQQLLHTVLSVQFHNLEGSPAALWLPVSEWSVSRMFRLAKTMASIDRWFTQVPLSFGRRLASFGLCALFRVNQLPIAQPIYAPIADPAEVVRWMKAELQSRRRLLLVTYPATAVRACAFAAHEGVSLAGAVILVAGEPVTAAKRAAIEASGAYCLPLFGCTETGEACEGCLAPQASDDMHLYEHKFALISKTMATGPDSVADVLLFTTLDPQTPKIFLNGDTGDVGIVEQRDCGCPWGRLGFRTHLHDIWSYSRLTAEGLTLPGDMVFSILEQELPARFGGKSGDYQLVAEPGKDGVAQYVLAVNPSLGPVHEEAVGRAFRDSLSRGSYGLTVEFLRRAGHLRVVRRPQAVQAGGKSLPVILQHGSTGILEPPRRKGNR